MHHNTRYSKRGVSATKVEIHNAIKNIDKGLFPMSFCKIIPDMLGNDANYCNIMHADGAGTKASLAYIYWRETGDISVWRGIAQDALIMNIDDLICAGATNNFLVSSTIGRNGYLIPGDVIREIIEGTNDVIKNLSEHGINCVFTGGETADIGDLTRTVAVDSAVTTRLHKKDVIDNANIQDGDVIVGLASFGRATYESRYNSGIGSNGLTSARHDILSNLYAQKYPESYDPSVPPDLVYSGSYCLTDKTPFEGVNLGQLLLSPTRTYAPVVATVLKEFRHEIHGMIHCSGGGQTKIMKFVNNMHVVKDNLFEPPWLFQVIQQQSNSGWLEMYQVFNMGHRLEICVKPRFAGQIIEIAKSFGIESKTVGYCQKADTNQLTVRIPQGTFEYW